MNSRSIGFVVVTLASFSSAARMEAPRTASMEFVGTTPCGETLRAFIGSMPAAAPCHAVTLQIDLDAADGWTMAAKYGSVSFDFEGVYTKVDPKKRIEYAMSDGRKVSLVFTDHGSSTEITETFDPENTHSLDQQREGWQAILSNFKVYTERN